VGYFLDWVGLEEGGWLTGMKPPACHGMPCLHLANPTE